MFKEHILNKLEKTDLSEIFHVFQPQLDLNNNKIIGVEMLSRWRYNDTTISPAIFINLAEEYNLIWKIDFLSLENAMEFIKENNIKTSVNISMKTLNKPFFEETIKNILSKYSSKVIMNLSIEITETISGLPYDIVKKNLLFLTNLGIEIFLDDFTIGFANLETLNEYPVTAIKIDKSIIKFFHKTSENKILNSFITFLKCLELKIIFEGIEKLDEIKYLLETNMKDIFIQGFYISEPLTKKELIYFLDVYRGAF